MYIVVCVLCSIVYAVLSVSLVCDVSSQYIYEIDIILSQFILI